jgi:salicylate hydroxylase
LKDSHILGRLLAHPSATKEKIPAILKLYEDLRLSPTQDAAENSRINGLMYEFNHPDFLFNDPSHPDGPSREDLKVLGKAVGLSFAWVAEGRAEEDWAKAEAGLKAVYEKAK